MKINLNKSASKQLLKLFDTLEVNMSAGQVALDLVDGFENLDLLETFSDVQTREEYLQTIKELFAFNENDPFQVELFNNHLLPSITYRDLSIYQNDPYYNLIKSVDIKTKNVTLLTKTYKKNQLFIFDDVKTSPPYYQETLSLAYPTCDYNYLALMQDDKIWMAIIPHEINTMKSAIEEAHGRVLVLGLGLGYYPFMIAAKKEVTSIIIIEKDQTIIKLFTKHLLPLFPHGKKIKIINGDAYNYLKSSALNFDYAFFDIYRSSNDDLDLYIKAIRQEKYYPSLKISYWLEDSMIAHLRRIVISYISEVFNEYQSDESSPLDEIFAHIETKLIDFEATSFEDITGLLTKDSIIKLIK